MHSLLLMHLGILNEAVTLINVFSLTGGKNALIKWVWTKISGDCTSHFTFSLCLAKLKL